MCNHVDSFEVIPGSADRSVRGPMSYLWWLRKKAYRKYSVTTGKVGTLVCSARSHSDHCHRHPKDKKAAMRMASLMARLEEITIAPANPKAVFFDADRLYTQRMLEFAGIPEEYRDDATVDDIDSSGSVRITFGHRSEGQPSSGSWVLYASGVLEKERTPFGLTS